MSLRKLSTVLAALGCSYVAAPRDLPARPAAPGSGSRAAEVLLAAGEDEWLVPAQPRHAGGPGRVTLEVAGGIGIPGGAEIGSAASPLPSYAEIWNTASAFDIAAEFPVGRKMTPYARLSIVHFYGRIWQNPASIYDVWQASEASLVTISGGVKLGGEGTPYGKLGLGIVSWPETSREDVLTGASTPLFESSTGLAVDLGAGVEMKLLKFRAFVEMDFWTGASPSGAPEAAALYPGFEADGALSLLTITGGLRINF